MMMNMLMTFVLALVMATASSTACTSATMPQLPQLDDSETNHCFTTTAATVTTTTTAPTPADSRNGYTSRDTKHRRGHIHILEEDEILTDVACTLCNLKPKIIPNASFPELNRSASAQVDQDQDQERISLFRIIGILLIRIIQHQPPQRLRG